MDRWLANMRRDGKDNTHDSKPQKAECKLRVVVTDLHQYKVPNGGVEFGVGLTRGGGCCFLSGLIQVPTCCCRDC